MLWADATMADSTVTTERITSRADLDSGDAGIYEYWMGQDRIAEKEEEKWRKRARGIVRRYRDERAVNSTATHRFNILWSNVQTLIPTLYGRTPKPDVQRRFKDQDDAGRLASTLLERCLAYSMDMFDFDAVMKAGVQDRLLPGRGTCRVLYIPHFGDEIESDKATDSNAEFESAEAAASDVDSPADAGPPEREVTYEEAVLRYVFWEDYREGPARTWEEVPWIRYRAYMNRKQLVTRFGKKGKKVELNFSPKGSPESDKNDPPPDIYRKAEIWEIWDKTNEQVIWIAPRTPDLVLDTVDDPLGLPGFYPSPDPLLATTTTDKRIPVPDFMEYQDQAYELDLLTGRIDRLTRALKVSGVYPGAQKQALQQLIDDGTENKLIPVEDWAAWSDKGGLQGMIQWMPIKEIAETLIRLYDARDRAKSLLYEVTGIGDILRGETNPIETATAQQLKANFSTRRIVPQQRDVARFARDAIRLLAGVIAEHFSAQTISAITGYPHLAPVPQVGPPPPQWLPAPMQAPPQQGMQPGMAPPGGSPPLRLVA